jgi:uridine phosphorylase
VTYQPHLQIQSGDVADVALLPGDPDRVDRIAGHCDGSETIAQNREYKVVNATTDGRDVTICSTGIGSPSAAIAVEELASVGCETFLRVGTCGGLQPGIDVGDVIVATAAAKDEGTTKRYESATVPAVASEPVVRALVDAADRVAGDSTAVHRGPVATDDAFYAETESAVADWHAAGLQAVEMEAAAIFTLARRKGLQAGAICTVDGNLHTGTQKGPSDDESELPEDATTAVGRAIDVALAAANQL